jgi:hypothetical protein
MITKTIVQSVTLVEGVNEDTKKPWKKIELTTSSGNKASLFVTQYTKQYEIDTILSWTPGQEVEVVVVPSTKKDSKGEFYKNFRLPTVVDRLSDKFDAYEKRLLALEIKVNIG